MYLLGTKINSHHAKWDCFQKKKNEIHVKGRIKMKTAWALMAVIRLIYWLGNTFVNGKGVQGYTRVGKNSAVWKKSQHVHSY